MRELLVYLMAFAVGIAAVAALPRLRVRARARVRPGDPQAQGRDDRLAERHLAVVVWTVGCLLTGALAALVAGFAG